MGRVGNPNEDKPEFVPLFDRWAAWFRGKKTRRAFHRQVEECTNVPEVLGRLRRD